MSCRGCHFHEYLGRVDEVENDVEYCHYLQKTLLYPAVTWNKPDECDLSYDDYNILLDLELRGVIPRAGKKCRGENYNLQNHTYIESIRRHHIQDMTHTFGEKLCADFPDEVFTQYLQCVHDLFGDKYVDSFLLNLRKKEEETENKKI